MQNHDLSPQIKEIIFLDGIGSLRKVRSGVAEYPYVLKYPVSLLVGWPDHFSGGGQTEKSVFTQNDRYYYHERKVAIVVS